VTAACLMIKREKFHEAGGFSTELPVAFNDVDFCFRLYEKGYQNVYINDSYAYHHESLSRGSDETPEKLKRLLLECDKLYKMHPGLEGTDPYYSIHLNRQGLDTRICPGFEIAGNCMQIPKKNLQLKNAESYRQDNCVLLRVEFLKNGILHGYCVVLGDNNACYEKEVIFISENNRIYRIPFVGQYRPDLVENLPDQTNVGLSGFWIKIPKLPIGNYRIGVIVRNRVTGLCLRNSSERYFEMSERGTE